MSKLTDLTEVTTLADGDLGMVVDVSNTSMDATGTNSRVTLANVYAYIKAKTDVLYQSILVSGSNIKTIGGVSVLGSGDISVGSGDMVLASSQTNSGLKTFLDSTFGLRNVANTFTSFFTNTNTASRTYTLKDASGTLAFTSDITGTNSGTNTGDQTSIVGITGTMAQFDTAVTDGNFVYQGQALGTPSSGTLTNATGLPVAGITASTTQALGVGSLEIGHASDTTLARVSAGVASIEGKNIALNGTSEVLTTGTVELGHASDTTIARASAGVASIEGNNIVVNTSSPTLATITTTGNIELGNASDTTLSRSSAGVLAVEGVVVPTVSSTNTLTNKRKQPRVYSAANNASLTPEIDTYDIFHLTAMSAATTINNHSTSTPADGELMQFRFLDNGTARALTWDTDYVAKAGVSLPTTTVLSKNLTVLFEWNSNLSKWNCLSVGSEA